MSALATAEYVPLDPPLFYCKYIQWLFTANIQV
jgi:hypothetical protein